MAPFFGDLAALQRQHKTAKYQRNNSHRTAKYHRATLHSEIQLSTLELLFRSSERKLS